VLKLVLIQQQRLYLKMVKAKPFQDQTLTFTSNDIIDQKTGLPLNLQKAGKINRLKGNGEL
jgi:hypothetical protein